MTQWGYDPKAWNSRAEKNMIYPRMNERKENNMYCFFGTVEDWFPFRKNKTGKRRIVEKNNSTTTKGCDANRKLRFWGRGRQWLHLAVRRRTIWKSSVSKLKLKWASPFLLFFDSGCSTDSSHLFFSSEGGLRLFIFSKANWEMLG